MLIGKKKVISVGLKPTTVRFSSEMLKITELPGLALVSSSLKYLYTSHDRESVFIMIADRMWRHPTV